MDVAFSATSSLLSLTNLEMLSKVELASILAMIVRFVLVAPTFSRRPRLICEQVYPHITAYRLWPHWTSSLSCMPSTIRLMSLRMTYSKLSSINSRTLPNGRTACSRAREKYSQKTGCHYCYNWAILTIRCAVHECNI